MNADESRREILKKFPGFAAHTSQDTDKNGKIFFEMVLPNEQNPNFPLTVTVNDRGCFLSWGAVDYIAGEFECSADDICVCVSDILSDEVMLVSVYPNEERMDERRPSLCDVCAKGSEKYEKIVGTAGKPLSLIGKLTSKWQGIIELTDWSGKNYTAYRRFFGKRG